MLISQCFQRTPATDASTFCGKCFSSFQNSKFWDIIYFPEIFKRNKSKISRENLKSFNIRLQLVFYSDRPLQDHIKLYLCYTSGATILGFFFVCGLRVGSGYNNCNAVYMKWNQKHFMGRCLDSILYSLLGL